MTLYRDNKMKAGVEGYELWAQAAVVVGTNLASLPCAWECWRHECYFEMWVGLGAVFVSMMYHGAEAADAVVLGMNDGKWHRLDNVFAIMSFVSLMLWLMDNKNRKHDELLRWFFFVLVTWAQERGPWILFYTVMPIALAFTLLLLKYLTTATLPIYFTRPQERRKFLFGLALLSIAMYFFAVGLDEKRDYLRWHHGMWHFFGGLSFYQFFGINVHGKGGPRKAE